MTASASMGLMVWMLSTREMCIRDSLIGAAEHAGVGGDRHVDERFLGQTHVFGERHGLGGAGVDRAEHHVVEQFQLIAVPERPDVEQFFFRSAEHEEHILDLGEGLIRAAERKSPAPHPGRAAHDRGVHKINAFGGKRLAHTDVHARIDRAHVDDHGALGRPGRDPALAEHDLFRVCGAGDEHQDDPGLARQSRRRAAHGHTSLCLLYTSRCV